MLRLKYVNPAKVKCVKVELVLHRADELTSLLSVPGQTGIARDNWGLVVLWYTGNQFNAMSDRLRYARWRPKWTTSIYYTLPHIQDNRWKWNQHKTETFPAD